MKSGSRAAIWSAKLKLVQLRDFARFGVNVIDDALVGVLADALALFRRQDG